LTAILEHEDGRMELVRYADFMARMAALAAAGEAVGARDEAQMTPA
jgi:hypothetical protein